MGKQKKTQGTKIGRATTERMNKTTGRINHGSKKPKGFAETFINTTGEIELP